MREWFAKLPPFWQRLVWLILIWTASVAALAIVAVLMHVFMRLLGMQ